MRSFRQFTIGYGALVLRFAYSYFAIMAMLWLLSHFNMLNYEYRPNVLAVSFLSVFVGLSATLIILEMHREKLSASHIKPFLLIFLCAALILSANNYYHLIQLPDIVIALSVIGVGLSLYVLLWFDQRSVGADAPDLVQKTTSFWSKYWPPIALALIVAGGLVLRVWNLGYLQGADNFNILAARALHENGSFLYDGNQQVTLLIAWLFKYFGVSWGVARIPMVICGTISIWLVYYLGSYVNKNVGLISSLLLAVSPVAIEKSSFIREYSEAMMWGLVATLILLKIYEKYKTDALRFLVFFPLALLGLTALVYLYSGYYNTAGIKSVLSLILFLSVSIIYEFLRLSYPKKLKYYLIVLLPALVLFLQFIHIPLNIFSKGYHFQQYWIDMFFNPMVNTPMQWYSYAKTPAVFILMLFALPLIFLYGKRSVLIFYFTFMANVLLFAFKYNPSGYLHSRYLYHLYPLFIVVMASGIYLLLKASAAYKMRTVVSAITIIFISVYIVIPSNTAHGAKHDLTIWEDKDSRQPTAAGNRNYYLDIINFLKNEGLTNKYPVAIQGEDQFFLTWYFNYPVTRKFVLKYNTGERQSYDFGDKLFIIDPYRGIDELDLALLEKDQGFLIGHSSDYQAKDFYYRGYLFECLGTVENFKIYRWGNTSK